MGTRSSHFWTINYTIGDKLMKPFWTITDIDTEHTNSRSDKFTSEENAICAAITRIQNRLMSGKPGGSIVILKAFKLVTCEFLPIKVQDIKEEAVPQQPGKQIV